MDEDAPPRQTAAGAPLFRGADEGSSSALLAVVRAVAAAGLPDPTAHAFEGGPRASGRLRCAVSAG